MCAILDANAASAVFGRNHGDAARAFFDWINNGSGSLVVGGKLRGELNKIGAFCEWQKQAVLAGRITNADDVVVDKRVCELEKRNACASNDQHIIALADVSGARLLYTNDRKLQEDFKNPDLIKKPRGRIYSAQPQAAFGRVHKRLLAASACRS